MTPENRLNAFVLGITISIMLVIIKLIPSNVIIQNSIHSITGLLLSFLTSAGIYLLIVNILKNLSQRIRRFRKILLGAHFMEGTWVGVIEDNKRKLYDILFIEQDLQSISLEIRGTNYLDDNTFSIWNSTATSLNIDKGVLMYSYTCMFKGSANTLHGSGILHLKRQSKHSSPNGISGFTYNFDANIREVNEVKISDEILEDSKALEIAKELYN